MLGLLLLPATGLAQEEVQDTLRVVTKPAPPFVMESEGGALTGLAIDLWREIAAREGLSYTITVLDDVPAVLAALEEGAADVAVGALTVTAEREARIDFTHTFLASGWAIAVEPLSVHSPPAAILATLLSPGFAVAAGALVALLLGAGALVWVFERRANRDMFGGRPQRGIGSGFWWAAVTMTTVGYGDKAPRTVGGRVVALVWMFASVVLVSSFTATITSELTATRIGERIESLADAAGSRIGVVEDTAAAGFLEGRGLSATGFASLEDGLAALAEGRIEAFVHDAPILRHVADERFRGEVTVVPQTYGQQVYALALGEGSPLGERLDLAVVEIVGGPAWSGLVRRYLPGKE